MCIRDRLGAVFDRVVGGSGDRLGEDDNEQANGQLHVEVPENEFVPFLEHN